MEITRAGFICEIPVFYATSEGQTRRIAEYIAAVLRDQGYESRALDVAAPETASLDWARVRAAALGASLHAGTHQAAAAAFVREHAAQLNAHPSAFFSVSLGAASRNEQERDEVRRLAGAFPPANGWNATWVTSLAGRLAYTRYGFLKRLLMKRIARKEGGPTDTSRDYELTDWNDADDLAGRILAAVRERTQHSAA